MSMMVSDERYIHQSSGRALRRAWIKAAQISVDGTDGDERATPESVEASGRESLVNADIKYLSPLIKQIVDLRHGPESDEYGVLRPTKDVYDSTCALLINAAIVSAIQARKPIPYGCVSTDSQGGVRIEWVRDSASIHLIVPASEDRDAYVYHEEGSIYGTEPASAEALASWLRLIKD